MKSKIENALFEKSIVECSHHHVNARNKTTDMDCRFKRKDSLKSKYMQRLK